MRATSSSGATIAVSMPDSRSDCTTTKCSRRPPPPKPSRRVLTSTWPRSATQTFDSCDDLQVAGAPLLRAGRLEALSEASQLGLLQRCHEQFAGVGGFGGALCLRQAPQLL